MLEKIVEYDPPSLKESKIGENKQSCLSTTKSSMA